MEKVKLQLVCGRCKAPGEFQDESVEEALTLAHVEGWVYLSFSPIGQLTRTKLADLCPKCFADLQYAYQPSTLSLFGGAYDAIRAGS